MMSCATDKTLPNRADHRKPIPSAEELPKLIQLQHRALKEMTKTEGEDQTKIFRLFVQGFG